MTEAEARHLAWLKELEDKPSLVKTENTKPIPEPVRVERRKTPYPMACPACGYHFPRQT